MKNKAVFLDRDGVIIEDKHYLTDKNQLTLLPGVGKALQYLKQKDYLLIVITNQSVIARKMCTEAQLDEIHMTLHTLLTPYNVTLDAIYYCPHHPEFKYKNITHCNCRKPKPGLLLNAIKDHNIDIKNSFMVGDKETDCIAGHKAGCKSVLLTDNVSKKDIKITPDYIYDTLLSFVNQIILI